MTRLRDKAESSLRANLIETRGGRLCAAGANQFKTLWARDFLYAVPGLVAIGERDLAIRQMKLLLKNQRGDGALPRGLDVVNPKLRVLNAVLKNPLALDYGTKALKPEYLGEHGTPAFDTNILWLNAFDKLGSFTLTAGESQLLESAKKYYVPNQDFLYEQPAFSDWMDSLKRKGPQLTFHLQLLATRPDDSQLKDRIEKRWGGSRQTESTDALLLALENNVGPQAEIEKQIKKRPIGVPHVEQPINEVSWTTKIVGLRHYHDKFAWSWLTAETARVFKTRDPDFSKAALTQLANVRSDLITEIYDVNTLEPIRTWAYRSEEPFSWGAAKTIEALL